VRKGARPTNAAAHHLLLVNGTKHHYANALIGAGYRVTTVASVREALASRARPDAVIVELVIPDGNLRRLAQAIKSGRRTRAMTVIALTGEVHEETVVQAGATFCRHPCPPRKLVTFVKRTLALRMPAGASGGAERKSRRV
jgi:DNA-binding response OmpR family regulator